ncbi:hypothetical protein SPRG_21596 [Saprolegnia parasitica CBS 223.65]|uniref:K Homology domain-containing protein n=1 Tax=Saprolegnia parasitica (strain CBS 223.65) TaxID=695850 RepID=A0A067BJT6_SAPPC|nr:hypothetical protein SPRG_21596 [Saprolegnia parasitica CBS 223.65]KDO17005.1 hypothetical protein SPRG_21596 [Saprolegnia parasitica CBS 223.65]|eukprot:XP_012212287.1 hypothetical protein SPRG_21596 [Saprolegnia parasitica CBS 223.65]
MWEPKSYTKTFMLVPADVAQSLNVRSGVELKELARSVNCLMYIVDSLVYRDCRILCVSGTPSEISAAMRVLVARVQEILRAKYVPTFESVSYKHDKAVVHIRSDFAAHLLEHASTRLMQVADATHTRIHITFADEMVIASPLRRLHILGDAENVKDACDRLHQVQSDFEAKPSDPSRLIYTLRLVLLTRDVMDIDNVRMTVMYEQLQVETKLIRQVAILPNKALFILTGTLENLYEAHAATVKAIYDGYERVRQRKQQQRDRDYSPDRSSYDKKHDYKSARHSSEERWTTKAILPTPPRVDASPPRSSMSPRAVHVTPVVPPPVMPFPYQPVPAPMPSAWEASANGWKLHDAYERSQCCRRPPTGPPPTAADNNDDTNNHDDDNHNGTNDDGNNNDGTNDDGNNNDGTNDDGNNDDGNNHDDDTNNGNNHDDNNDTNTNDDTNDDDDKIVQLSRSTTPVAAQRTTIVNLGGINKSCVDFCNTEDRLKRPLSDPPMPPAKTQRTLLSDMASGAGRTVYLADATSSRYSSSTSRRHVTLVSGTPDKSSDDSHRQRATNDSSASAKTPSASSVSSTTASAATTATTATTAAAATAASDGASSSVVASGREPSPPRSVASSRAPSPVAVKAAPAPPSSVEPPRSRASIPLMQTQVEMRVDMDTADKILTGGGLRRLAQASSAVVSFQIDPLDANMTKILLAGDLLAVIQVQQEINAILHS